MSFSIIILVLSILLILFALLAIMFFRLRLRLAGSIFAVLTLLLLLGGLKAMQFKKMLSTPMQMPATTVASAIVKEVDWAPVLSAVGSVSPVQGAMVSAELGGTVSEVLFQNGGTARKGDVLMRLDTSSE